MKTELKYDKGVAGLTVLLSVIVALFVIGLIVMIFALMSGEIQDTDIIYERTSPATVGLESISLTDSGTAVSKASLRGAQCTFVAIYNDTTLLGDGNVTEISECTWKNNSYYSDWKINYTYTYLADEYGVAEVINDTSSAVGGVTDWFDIFIVISSMVVLILLVVIIITAIRGSGFSVGEKTTVNGAKSVGTA